MWVCPRDKSPLIEVRISIFWPKMHLSTVKVPIDFGIDWPRSFSFISNFKPVIFFQTLRLPFICVILYVFSEAIASECSTSLMAPHIYWFPWMRTGSRQGPWNSLPLYLGETMGVSTSLDSAIGTGFYNLLLVFAIYMLRMSKFYMPILINHQNNSKTAPFSLYFVPVSSWGSRISAIFSVVNTYAIQDTCVFHILTSFVHVGPLDMLTTSAVSLSVNCEHLQEIP